MANDSAWNMYIFRDGKSRLSGPQLLAELAEALRVLHYSQSHGRTCLLDALLRSGELECALADQDSPRTASVRQITDSLAAALVGAQPCDPAELSRAVRRIEVPTLVEVSTPEGFAYYSLHPLDFADLVVRIGRDAQDCLVVGIRSIGTTLSAVVKAKLLELGKHVERITVRPAGHPYDREVEFHEDQRALISEIAARSGDFLVVDEGPGMSGSSLLAVGEALVKAGVERSRITFLCTRDPDVNTLTTRDAARRWRQFGAHQTWPTRYLPADAKTYIAGGIWRATVFSSESLWPASWLQMERLKFLSSDRKRLYKFEGIGRFGELVRQRSARVADAGFGPMPLPREEGFGVYPIVDGCTMTIADATARTIRRVAEYCGARMREFHCDATSTSELEKMLRFNSQSEFGAELPAEWTHLPMVHPVIADGRMLPHKWIQTAYSLIKIDSAIHGDDHFFPGPTDIAWDLAGVIVEWQFSREATDYFLDCYHHASGDDAGARLRGYLLAYSIFRMAYCKMAAAAMRGSSEEQRMARDYSKYRAIAAGYMSDAFASSSRRVSIPIGPLATLRPA